MRILPPVEEKIRRAIRGARAKDPLIMSDQRFEDAAKRANEYRQKIMKAAGESDRGFAITVAAILDFYLEQLIKAFLIDVPAVRELFEGAYAPFNDLAAKSKAAYFMGLITKNEADEVNAIRRVRNVFAHEIDASFTHPNIVALCKKPPIYDAQKSERDAFISLAVGAGVFLIHRIVDVTEREKRKPLDEPKSVSILDPS